MKYLTFPDSSVSFKPFPLAISQQGLFFYIPPKEVCYIPLSITYLSRFNRSRKAGGSTDLEEAQSIVSRFIQHLQGHSQTNILMSIVEAL